MAKVLCEGQTYELPDDQVATDEGVISALRPYFPGVDESEIKRENNPESGLVVTVVKVPATKGGIATIWEALRMAPRYLNTAVALATELDQLETAMDGFRPEYLLGRRGEILTAIETGQREAETVRRIWEGLSRTPARAFRIVPVGF